jgi:hypothetical protein
MLVQCATASFLFSAGDVIAQQGIEKRGINHDVRNFVATVLPLKFTPGINSSLGLGDWLFLEVRVFPRRFPS